MATVKTTNGPPDGKAVHNNPIHREGPLYDVNRSADSKKEELYGVVSVLSHTRAQFLTGGSVNVVVSKKLSSSERPLTHLSKVQSV